MRRIAVSREGEDRWSGGAWVLGNDMTKHYIHPSPTVYRPLLFDIPGLCVLPIIHFNADRTPLSLCVYVYIFFPTLTVAFSVSLMQPCHYVKCCFSGLFVCLIAAECYVSRTGTCILKQSQCGIIRHLTTLRADRPSSTEQEIVPS